jgi:hypothetical protein
LVETVKWATLSLYKSYDEVAFIKDISAGNREFFGKSSIS